MASKCLKAIILGPPGSGKGTISSRIVRDFGLKHLSSGDLFREQIRNETDVGKKATEFIKMGQLVPDAITIQLITEELKKSFHNCNWLLDGFPRNVFQAQRLSENEEINVVLNLNVPNEEIIERIQQRWIHEPSGRVYHLQFSPPKNPGVDDHTDEPLIQREDDKPDTVLARLQQYEKLTKPLLDYYEDKKLLKVFNGRESNEIWPRVHRHLSEFISPKSGPF